MHLEFNRPNKGDIKVIDKEFYLPEMELHENILNMTVPISNRERGIKYYTSDFNIKAIRFRDEHDLLRTIKLNNINPLKSLYHIINETYKYGPVEYTHNDVMFIQLSPWHNTINITSVLGTVVSVVADVTFQPTVRRNQMKRRR